MLGTNLFSLIASLALVIPATAYPQLQARNPNAVSTSFSAVGYSDYNCEGHTLYSWTGSEDVQCAWIESDNVKSLEIQLADEYTGTLTVAIHENDDCTGVIRRGAVTGSNQRMCLAARYEEDPNQSIKSWDAERRAYHPPVVGF